MAKYLFARYIWELTTHVEDDSSFRNGELRRWLVNSVAVSSIVRQAEDLEDRISLEHIPSSKPFLPDIIQAMRENKVVYSTNSI